MWRAIVLGTALLVVPSVARAQQAGADAGEDLRALQQELAQDESALQTNDCPSACRALASMRRAADRLCALDPGDPCAEARAKVSGAAERVRAACPECEAASAAGSTTRFGAEAPAPTRADAKEEQVAQAAPAKRGGCAGCASAGAAAPGGAFAALALAVVAIVRRRRRRV